MNELVKIGIRVLEVLFFGGCIGSLIVVVVAGIEDFATVFESGESEDGGAVTGDSSSQW